MENGNALGSLESSTPFILGLLNALIQAGFWKGKGSGFRTPYKAIIDALLKCGSVKVTTALAVYANWSFEGIKGRGWDWAGVIYLLFI
ncbi:hypothetical protein Ahy_A09g045878 [Arachis hypogaea]|uniref:Uncharacterized protein n=1 Tax=Arachis hypogaea TaxID=3818 RepID=A0A445BNC7_ARAHY|nr:hypothetical protein Ahy_A09g045878 [Arachis hypogaea]